MQGSLMVLDHTGHSTLEWDTTDTKSVEEVKAAFDTLIERNFSVFRQDDGGEGGSTEGARLTEFDPSAKEMIAVGPIAGG